MRLEDRVWAWSNSTEIYVKESVAKVEKYLSELTDAPWYLPKKKAENPSVWDYLLDMDDTPDLEQELAYWYHYFIVMLIWMLEMGRVYIITEVSMIAPHMAMPREGHLEAVLNALAFIHQKYNYRFSFDPTYPTINMSEFKECNRKAFY